MITLLIIADDFTGALDTGVKFAEKGAVIHVVADHRYDFGRADAEVQVLVIDAETRHMQAEQAYQRVYDIVKRAKMAGIPFICKKTDSALRGNIGSELRGMLDASGERILHFIPAFPKMGRTTEHGVQYIHGVPVCESVFGKDPFEPVTASSISELICQQGKADVRLIKDGRVVEEVEKPLIAVYDAKTDEEIQALAHQLKETGQLGVIAGCAGLAEALPELLNLEGRKRREPCFPGRFLAVCGSVNPITRRQTAYARRHGFGRIALAPEEVLDPGFYQTRRGEKRLDEIWRILAEHERCILDTGGQDSETWDYAKEHGLSKETVRERIADTLGIVLKELLNRGISCTMMITGGDSLMGFMKQAEECEMFPIGELMVGVVLSEFKMNGRTYDILSKSGGFGGEKLLVELADKIQTRQERGMCHG